MVFHGRADLITNTASILTQPETARIAIVGARGMGKTTVALELLHDTRVKARFERKIIQSCEALLSTDALVGSLAELLGIPVHTTRLQTAVIAKLSDGPRTLLVLDNIETIWLVEDGVKSAAFEELLGKLVQVPSLSLIITCRGINLPPSIDWSNSATAVLEPFSLRAAMRTFEDRAQRRIMGDDVTLARELLFAVDMIPLAVTILGQLCYLGNSVSKLLSRWNRENISLLHTFGSSRSHSVEVSIELSISMMRSVEAWDEALQLLSLCSLLPDGVRPGILKQLEPQFGNIHRALDTLSAYALVSVTANGVVKTLSPVRYFVMKRYPAQSNHRDALNSIFLDIANRLPVRWNVDEWTQFDASGWLLEWGNLASLLQTMLDQPSRQVVDAVISFTKFLPSRESAVAIAYNLLLHLEQHPQ